MKFIAYLSMVAVLISCSQGVIQRDMEGRRSAPPQNQQFQSVKKKIALLSFFNESPYGGEDLGIVATEELRKELSRTGEFIVDPMAMKIFGSSKEVYAGGGVKLVQLSRRAKIEGVNLVVFGRVIEARVREKTDEIGFVRETKSFTEAKLEIRIFDVNSNKEIYTETLNGYADDQTYRFFAEDRENSMNQRRDLLRYGVRVAARKAIPNMIEISRKLDWMGRIAKIVGTRIYVNAGRESGLQIGDVLKVLTEGQEIFDPETGALIGVSKGDVKGTIEIIDYFGPDGTIGTLHSGGSVLEGDFVQLY
ncbi:MAG: hypothetical protein COW01_02080 [Bdellovibrionales bacterium CG12_big_fil_rev_8_21_14_0_65_38_15]|nr:MAG: hypothetical protein COW79_02315 [Bdellovibrionales bacterium CG22_combo_CG10-13_8_21_14_all_38_13]PIQ57094.1 MAG: hypothetical protein COW01_02080 [Bdellovibrionales bacterium CG12_big_fil_rev_8_21_14_0_65_38_15]PIR30124.1 MAG: hypothetical protein COV38_07475 [Bdellovibrionales bacterium CG11_big_fil_rev_8_21_14_0_20_38_13]